MLKLLVSPTSLQKRPNESQASFQGRRVTAELREKVPPLLTLVLQSVASETHLTLRLLVDQALFLLLRPALTAFPSSVLSLLDALVVDVTDDSEVLQSVSQLLMATSDSQHTRRLDSEFLSPQPCTRVHDAAIKRGTNEE